MKEPLDRHQERLSEIERRSLLARVDEAARSRARGGGEGEIALRRWAVSFGVAVAAIVIVSVVLIVRNEEGRDTRISGGRSIEFVGRIPAGPAPRARIVKTDQAGEGSVYQERTARPFIATEQDSVSFFAVRVGKDSYRRARASLLDGSWPEPQDARVEEFVNAFQQGLADFDEPDLRIHADGSPDPFHLGVELVRIGIKTRRATATDRDSIVAENVQVAITFDPRRVPRYRLLGFEEAKGGRAARNAVQGGYEVAALYEVRISKGAPSGRLATVRLSYATPGRPGSREVVREVVSSDVGPAFETSPARFRLDAAAARFAEILRMPRGDGGREGALADLLPIVRELADEMRADARVAEFARMVERAAEIARSS